jgi:hypothetical protein
MQYIHTMKNFRSTNRTGGGAGTTATSSDTESGGASKLIVDAKDMHRASSSLSPSVSTLTTPSILSSWPSFSSAAKARQQQKQKKRKAVLNFSMTIEGIDGIVSSKTRTRRKKKGPSPPSSSEVQQESLEESMSFKENNDVGDHDNVNINANDHYHDDPKHGKRIMKEDEPVFVVVTLFKKGGESDEGFKVSCVSSPMIRNHYSIGGNRKRYMAKFSARETDANDEQLPLESDIAVLMTPNKHTKSGYDSKKMDLRVSLLRGTEMVKIGSTSITLNGSETGLSKLVAVGTNEMVKNRVKKPNGSMATTTLGSAYVAFTDEPSHKYTLQRANIRISFNRLYKTG